MSDSLPVLHSLWPRRPGGPAVWEPLGNGHLSPLLRLDQTGAIHELFPIYLQSCCSWWTKSALLLTDNFLKQLVSCKKRGSSFTLLCYVVIVPRHWITIKAFHLRISQAVMHDSGNLLFQFQFQFQGKSKVLIPIPRICRKMHSATSYSQKWNHSGIEHVSSNSRSDFLYVLNGFKIWRSVY